MKRIIYNSLLDAAMRSKYLTTEENSDGKVTLLPEKQSFISCLRQTFGGIPLVDPIKNTLYNIDDFNDDDVRLKTHPFAQLAYPEKSKLTRWFNEISIVTRLYDEEYIEARNIFIPEYGTGWSIFQSCITIVGLVATASISTFISSMIHRR